MGKETKEKVPEKTPVIGEFELVNLIKVERALHGDLMNDGSMSGGVADKEGDYNNLALLAEYDRIGGYIRDDEGNKVKNGSFWDLKAKKAFAKPQIVRIFQINGEFIEIAEGDKTPKIVEAQKEYDKAKKILKEDKKKDKKPRLVSKKLKV